MKMSVKFKAIIIAVLAWCIVMPLLWLNNISISSGVEISGLMVGFRPQMAMIALCLAGMVLLFIKEAWMGYYLAACAVIPFAGLLVFGALSAGGVILNTVLLTMLVCIVFFRRRRALVGDVSGGERI